MDQLTEAMQGEPFSSDVRAFCSLVSRIIMRCLREHNEEALKVLALSSTANEQKQEGSTNDSAA